MSSLRVHSLAEGASQAELLLVFTLSCVKEILVNHNAKYWQVIVNGPSTSRTPYRKQSIGVPEVVTRKVCSFLLHLEKVNTGTQRSQTFLVRWVEP
jgi:hypothetical protein